MARGGALYAALPVAGQHAAVTAYGAYWKWLRFGPGYKSALRGYLERERLGQVDLERYQRDALASVLRAAATHVPYYRRTWSTAEKRAAERGVLQDLPLLEKEPLRTDARDFCRDDVSHRLQFTFHTSGSTGTPIASIWRPHEIRDSLALREARSARWAGVSFALPRSTFSGRMVEPDPDSSGPFYRYNAVERQIYLSPFHLRPDTAAVYAEAFRRHRIRWATGYAVSYYLFAKFILDAGVDMPKLDAVVTTSEKLTAPMRDVMERAFGGRIAEEYSTVENALFASECEHGSLHVSSDAGIVEILRDDGSTCDPGEVGEVVATCLMRDHQPLIRFRLGDLGAWAPDPCRCGRSLPVIAEVTGRIEDVLVGPDGRQLVRFHGIFVDQPNVVEGQVVQETRERFRVKVVPGRAFGPDDVANIEARMHQRLGAAAEVIVESVPAIPRTASGKFRAVVSLLDDTPKGQQS